MVDEKRGKSGKPRTPGKPDKPRRQGNAKAAANLRKPAAEPGASSPTAGAAIAAKTHAAGKTKAEADSLIKRITSLPGAVAGGAVRWAVKTSEVPLKVGKALLLKPEQAAMMEEAGRLLKDLREVAGLTLDDLALALELKDRSLLEAVENGTATLSFELVLRLAAVLARHDPVPVVLRFARTYNPELWKILEDWGFGKLSLNFEREREFINIYRRHDAARRLSDEGFSKVLDFTRAAFEMALHFAAEQEHLSDQESTDDLDAALDGDDSPT